jgi:hypothetical protein
MILLSDRDRLEAVRDNEAAIRGGSLHLLRELLHILHILLLPCGCVAIKPMGWCLEAWLRTLALDFEGARRLCEITLRTETERTARQPKTVAMLFSVSLSEAAALPAGFLQLSDKG